MIGFKKIRFVLSFAFLFLFFSCSDMYVDDASLSIILPLSGKSGIYTVGDVQYYLVKLKNLEGNDVLSKKALPGEEVIFSVFSEGDFTVSVTGYSNNDNATAYGEKEVLLKTGEKTEAEVEIQLAKFYEVSFQIASFADENSIQMENQFVSELGGKLNFNTFATRGRIFAGWTTVADNQGYYPDVQEAESKCEYKDGDFIVPSEDMNLYAVWTTLTYSIKYVLNGGSNSPSNPTSYKAGGNEKGSSEAESITIFPPSKDGCIFVGWVDSDGNPLIDVIEERIMPLSEGRYDFRGYWLWKDVTLYAKWE